MEWSWKISSVNDSTLSSQVFIGSTNHVYYTVLDTDQAPMGDPWVDVLDDACVWAHGETIPANAAIEITKGIYDNLGDTDNDIDYDGAYSYFSNGDSKINFYLTYFLSEISSVDDVKVDCNDVANLFNIYSTSVGCSSQNRKMTPMADSLTTNSIDPIGSPGWATKVWNYHKYGWLSLKAYDACLEITSGLLYNLTQDDYEDSLLDEGTIDYFYVRTTTIE